MGVRGLSHLPVAEGMEAQVLNREVIPFIRDLGADVAAIATNLETMLALLNQIELNQEVPPGGTVFGFVAGIGTGSNANFPTKTVKRGVQIFNLDATNNLLVSTGTPGAADANTFTVKPGLLSPFLPCTDVSVFNLRSSAGTISACYAGA